MSRVIKFRAWSKGVMTILSPSTDHWVYFDEDGLTTIQHDMELMQFTGLQDCEGKDIYEGDIITDEDGIQFTIKFRDGMFYCDEGRYFSTKSAIANHSMQYYKITGNIYEVKP